MNTDYNVDDYRANDGPRGAVGEQAADDLQADMVTLARELASIGEVDRADRLCRMADRVFMLSCGIRQVYGERSHIGMWVDRVWHEASDHPEKWHTCGDCARESKARSDMWVDAAEALVTVFRDHALKDEAGDLRAAIARNDQARVAWHFETGVTAFRDHGLDLWSLIRDAVTSRPARIG